jgi:hypothetical protein
LMRRWDMGAKFQRWPGLIKNQVYDPDSGQLKWSINKDQWKGGDQGSVRLGSFLGIHWDPKITQDESKSSMWVPKL